MRSVQCECGEYIPIPDVVACPYCHKELLDYSDEFSKKHVARCSRSVNPRTYSQRSRGRPVTEDVPETIPPYRRTCNNCATSPCAGKEGLSACSRWTVRLLERCPFCGNNPVTRTENGILTEIRCDRCRVTMRAYNVRNGSEALISRWNRTD